MRTEAWTAAASSHSPTPANTSPIAARTRSSSVNAGPRLHTQLQRVTMYTFALVKQVKWVYAGPLARISTAPYSSPQAQTTALTAAVEAAAGAAAEEEEAVRYRGRGRGVQARELRLRLRLILLLR